MKKRYTKLSTRYQGSKRRLLHWLEEIFSAINFKTCLDLFGGSGSVSFLLKTLNKSVTFNDYLKFNTISAKAFIQNDYDVLTDNEFDLIFSKHEHPTVVADLYKNIYFTNDENILIDNLVYNIISNPEIKLSDFKKSIALHSLFQALLMKRPFNLFHRANLNLRTNNVTRKFGNKKTWEIPIKDLMDRIRKEINNLVFSNKKRHYISNLDAKCVVGDFDLVYIDPPYFSEKTKSSQNYFEYYHFLEGLVDYANWSERIDFSRKHKPLKDIPASFTRKTILQDFEVIFNNFVDSILVISYKSPGYPSIEDLTDLLNISHRDLNIYSKNHRYSLNKNNGHYNENVFVAYPK